MTGLAFKKLLNQATLTHSWCTHYKKVITLFFNAHTKLYCFYCARLSYKFNTLFYFPERFGLAMETMNPARLFSGISSYGGFLGGVIGAFIWRRRRQIPLLELGDATAFAAPFGWVFGRMGCAVTHDHPGGVTNFFLGIRGWDGTPYTRHDLGLYEVIWSAAVMALLLVLVQRKRTPGFYVALVPTLYAPYRFLLDFLRIDAALVGGDAALAAQLPHAAGIVGPAVMALAALSAIGRVRRAAWQNHRYHFTTWRWGRAAAGLLVVVLALKVALAGC